MRRTSTWLGLWAKKGMGMHCAQSKGGCSGCRNGGVFAATDLQLVG